MRKIKIIPIGKTDTLFSPESLEAFVQSAVLGSFSQAARKLNKSQSTISEAIALLEIDIGLPLFDRSSQKTVLTAKGKVLFRYAKNILASMSDFNQVAYQLHDGIEPQLSLAISDVLSPEPYEILLDALNEQFPTLEFNCTIAEDSDIIDLLMQQKMDIGLLATQKNYPNGIDHIPIPYSVSTAIYVANHHPLAKKKIISYKELSNYRTLQMIPLYDKNIAQRLGSMNLTRWSASSYFMVMEMAVGGFGWAELPIWLVEKYSANKLTQLTIAGWPRPVSLDAVWLTSKPLGKAADWLLKSVVVPKGKMDNK